MPLPSNPTFDCRDDRYARFRPDYPSALVDVLAELCPSHQLALDVGCGSGQLSCALGERFKLVVATDVSASQIRDATRHPTVEYHVAPAEAAPLGDHSVDLLTAAQAAHWFDLDAFYNEARRLIRPDGVVALLSYGVPRLGGELAGPFDDWYWGDAHRFWPDARHHVETGYRDLPFPFDELAAPALAIERGWSLTDFLGYISTWSATRQAALDGHDLVTQVREIFAKRCSDDEMVHVSWPINGRIGRV